jgi:penicillin amidase
MRAWVKVLAASAGLGLAVVAAALGFLYRSLPQLDGELAVEGLRAPVDVVRDESGIPHVYAHDLEDAYFGLGYAHAQDRLWQMEQNRRVGAGRLAEILGERALPIDRLFRTLGLVDHAQVSEQQLDAPTRRLLEAYVRGINAWLGEGHPLPLEHTLLGLQPERWTTLDSLVLMRVLAWQLSGN